MAQLDPQYVHTLENTANRLRIESIEATNAAKSGHPTSCASMAEIVSVLFFHTMRFHVTDPRNPNNDRFVLSKGHAAPILYAAWAEAGLFPVSELLKLRKIDSDLEGHPTPRLSFVDVATGSLGQGIGCAAGMAYTGKHFDKADYRVYTVLGDGECAEGSVWEAANFAGIYKLDNLVAVVDANRLGQSGPTPVQHDVAQFARRFEAFGWHSIVVDGHNVTALVRAFEEAQKTKGKPTAVIAETFKGKNFPKIENELDWHGKALGDKADAVIKHLRGLITEAPNPTVKPPTSKALTPHPVKAVRLAAAPNYKPGDKVATRNAFGNALASLGKSDSRVVALDADVKNSTFSITFMKEFPDRFMECYIAEQNMVSVAVGCATRGRTIPFASTFACFLSRAYDQIRMAAISQSSANFAGSHCGVSIGEDGPSQMALEDLAAFRAIPNIAIFYPSDAVSTERAVELAANYPHMTYIRTSRPNFPILYKPDEEFAIGKGKVVRKHDKDVLTIVAAGVTLHEAVKAAEQLEKENIHVRIVDIFSVKPIDKDLLLDCAKATNHRILTVEDHYLEGGVGEAVASALSDNANVVIKHVAVRSIPRSGQPEELLALYQLDAAHIVKEVKSF